MAHNGDLAGHRRIRHELLAHVPAALREQIAGNTDSETIYALVMGLLEDPEEPTALVAAIARAVVILRELRAKHGIAESSSLNLFFSDGRSIVALRYTLDFGCYDTSNPADVHEANLRYLSLWYTVGERYGLVDGEWQMSGDPAATDAVLLASEPLTRDITGWIEVPEYTVLVVDGRSASPRIHSVDLD
jgi:glutamine amidotransferase